MDTTNLAAAFARGTMWSIGMRWMVKLAGLASTVILARLLAPSDFGIVAMAMLVIGFIEVFFAVGSEAVVLRDPDASRELIDTAWTLKVIESLCVAVVIALASPLAASFFHEPRLVPVMLALCFGIAISGFGSYGPMLARKELDFGLEVRLVFWAKALTFVITIGVAFWLRTYWALVIGTVVGYASGCIFSYTFHSYRSRFTLSRIREIWKFSQWMLVMSVGQFFTRKTDEFLLARIGNTYQMGLYSVSSDLGQTVSAELSSPINRALLPVLAKIQGSTQRMKAAVAKLFSASTMLILPAGFGLAAVSGQAVTVVLGPQWAAAAPLLEVFAVAWTLRYMAGPYPVILMVMGKPRILAVLVWTEAAVLVALALVLAPYGMRGLVWARAVSCVAGLVIWVAAGTTIGLRVRDFLASTWRPMCSAVAMFVAVRALPEQLGLPFAWLDLIARIATGVLVYTACIMVTWHLLKRPDGLESRAVALAGQMLGHLRHRHDPR